MHLTLTQPTLRGHYSELKNKLFLNFVLRRYWPRPIAIFHEKLCSQFSFAVDTGCLSKLTYCILITKYKMPYFNKFYMYCIESNQGETKVYCSSFGAWIPFFGSSTVLLAEVETSSHKHLDVCLIGSALCHSLYCMCIM